MQNENRQNGNPWKYPFIIHHSHSTVDNNAGLKGIDRDVAKVQLDIASSLSRFRQAVNTGEAEFTRLVARSTTIAETAVGRYVALGDAYLPTDPDKLRFRMKVLCGMGCKRLKAFLPYLNELYDNESSPLRRCICLTEWSIEALVRNGDSGNGKWVDLRTLDVECIHDLRNLVGITPPTTQSAASTHRDTFDASASLNEIEEAYRASDIDDVPFWNMRLSDSFENMSL